MYGVKSVVTHYAAIVRLKCSCHFPAQHVVKKDRNIQKAMKFLQDCGNILKIEDILPFFDDFVTIDHFKVSFKSD